LRIPQDDKFVPALRMTNPGLMDLILTQGSGNGNVDLFGGPRPGRGGVASFPKATLTVGLRQLLPYEINR
jgi:hypothetical protein